MANYITSITVAEYNQRFSDWEEVSSLNSAEDVATFIDTFEAANIKGYIIAGVITKDGKYIFVRSDQNTGYDFIIQLNKLTPSNITISAQNAKLLFGKDKSRGYYVDVPKFEEPMPAFDVSVSPIAVKPSQSATIVHSENEIPSAILDDDNSKTEMFEEDDASATGFMDEDDYAEHGISTVQYYLIRQDNGMSLRIPDSRGITIGRSASRVDYVIDSPKVSRKHARIYLSGDECKIEDCDSSNGTFVDGLRVRANEGMVLSVNSTILIGDIEFKLTVVAGGR